MKKLYCNIKTAKYFSIHFSVAIAIALLLGSCGGSKQTQTGDYPIHVLIYKKPDASKKDFDAWVSNVLDRYTNVKKINTCNYCDNELMMLEISDPNQVTNLKDTNNTVIGGSKGKKVTSADICASLCGPGKTGCPIFCMPNGPIGLPKSNPSAANNNSGAQLNNEENNKKSVIIAVLDTGIDPDKLNSFTKDSNSKSKKSAPQVSSLGLNIQSASHSSNWKDDHPNAHGTMIAKAIVTQSPASFGKITLLPIKTYDQAGTTDLFTSLCGVAYAAKNGADYIYVGELENYAKPNSSELLQNFFQQYIPKSNNLSKGNGASARLFQLR